MTTAPPSPIGVRVLEPPARPGAAVLVGIHLRALLRDAPAVWGLAAVVALVLPVWALVVPPPREGMDLAQALFDPMTGGFLQVLWMTKWLLPLVALAWPAVVWRSLPPGGRHVLDVLPASRRANRLARVAAGFVFPLLLAAGAILATIIVEVRPAVSGIVQLPLPAGLGEDPLRLVVAPLALAVAYLAGSALALRYRRPLLVGAGLLVGVGLLFFVLNMIAIGSPLLDTFQLMAFFEHLMTRTWSPVRIVSWTFVSEASGILPALVWLAPPAFLCWRWSARHA